MSDVNNYDEINKFSNQANSWWDLSGPFQTLHQINPIRMGFIEKHVDLNGKKAIDIGCGGGILAEALAKANSQVTGLDLSKKSIEIAKLHLYESHLEIDYQNTDIESYTQNNKEKFDVLTCMEMLEHVNDPQVIINNCASLLKPGGIAFFSTLNRNLKSYLLGVIAAEYILNLLPRGTHDYKKFIKPSMLNQMLNKAGFKLLEIKGIKYNPFTKSAKLSGDVDINYIVCCQKQ